MAGRKLLWLIVGMTLIAQAGEKRGLGIVIENNTFTNFRGWISPEYQAMLDKVFPMVESGMLSKDAWEIAENEAIPEPNLLERLFGYKKASLVITEMSEGGYHLKSGAMVNTPARSQYTCPIGYELFFSGEKPLCRRAEANQ